MLRVRLGDHDISDMCVCVCVCVCVKSAAIFWDVTPRSSMKVDGRFGGTRTSPVCCLLNVDLLSGLLFDLSDGRTYKICGRAIFLKWWPLICSSPQTVSEERVICESERRNSRIAVRRDVSCCVGR
jgi:hypothetical protein